MTLMFVILLVFQKSWDDYYKVTYQTKYGNQEFDSDDTPLSPTTGNSYVFNCYFYDLTAYDGGAILYSVSNSYLLVEKCSIYKCNASHYTAGIRVTAGNCILAYVCGQNCTSSTNDGFCSVSTDTSIKINSVFDSSVSHCEAVASYTMVHQQGHVYIKSVNISHNKVNSYSALSCGPNKNNEETNHGSDVLYCSFSNNTATSKFCIIFDSVYNSSCTHEIKNCNIILNEGNNLIYGIGQTDAISCCIMNNTKRPIFSGLLTLYNCSVSSDQFEGSTVNTDSLGTITFIHGLTFISTGSCYASFDAIGSLIPTQIPRTKNCVRNTCDKSIFSFLEHVMFFFYAFFLLANKS